MRSTPESTPIKQRRNFLEEESYLYFFRQEDILFLHRWWQNFNFKFINLMFLRQLFALTRSCAALRVDLGLSGQDAFLGRTFGRFPASSLSTTAHVNGKSWTESDWLNHTIEGFLQQHFSISAKTLHYFCNFLLHFCNTFHLHWVLNGTPLIQKTSRDEHGAPTDLLWCKWESAHGVIQLKVIIFRDLRGVTTDLLDV